MKLTVWQFLALIAALVAGYLIYTTWFSKQDQSGWIRNWNNSIQGSEERVTTEQKGGAAGGGDPANPDAPAVPEKNVW